MPTARPRCVFFQARLDPGQRRWLFFLFPPFFVSRDPLASFLFDFSNPPAPFFFFLLPSVCVQLIGATSATNSFQFVAFFLFLSCFFATAAPSSPFLPVFRSFLFDLLSRLPAPSALYPVMAAWGRIEFFFSFSPGPKLVCASRQR